MTTCKHKPNFSLPQKYVTRNCVHKYLLSSKTENKKICIASGELRLVICNNPKLYRIKSQEENNSDSCKPSVLQHAQNGGTSS